MTQRHWLLVAAILGACGVALGAFGAHWLEGAVQTWGLPPEEQARRLDTWQVAVRYQMYHVLAIFGVALLAGRPARSLTAAGMLFMAGTLVFSGCLYALVLTGIKILGAIVPLGGSMLIAGWVALALAARRMDAELR